VNIAGCLAAGLAVPALSRGSPGHALAAIGFLGAFTTFSACSVQTLELVAAGRSGLAAIYAVGSLVTCLLATAAGWWLGRMWS
jgi:fluoride exporter